MKLVTALLVKNEAGRYLTRVLERCKSFSDKICVVDDRSTDNTVEICRDFGCLVKERSVLKDPAWGHESVARQELWDFSAQEADNGWVLVCDSDMILEGDPRELIQTWDVGIWAFVLWDCWDNERQARVDGPWQYGPLVPRPWLFRPSVCVDGPPQWNTRGLHCGHSPMNLVGVVGVAPADTYYWRHLAYCKADDRVKKHEQYMANAPLLTEFERMHAMSIADA